MENCVKKFLQGKGYTINEEAQSVIKKCDDWYANREVTEFHNRTTAQGTPYKMHRINFAKRCCSDDANLCEVVEINSGKDKEKYEFVKRTLEDNNFNTMYRRQLEKTSADGTVGCYVRMENVKLLRNGKAQGGVIKLNYVDADCYIPLTLENNIVSEAAFSGNSLEDGKKRTTLVIFRLGENGKYVSETHIFNELGKEMEENGIEVQLGEVKPFAVMQTAEVNNIDDMDGYGLPKILKSIPYFEALDLCFNILFGDLDKGEKLVLVNELLCKFDGDGKAITPNEQVKKTFVMLGEKLSGEKEVYHEYNPEIRIEQITKVFELVLSLLSMSFGYGSKKYTFENGNITTATEYIGQKQDQMQELNRQRYEATQYITGIVKAILWYSNTFQGKNWDVEEEVVIDFDDSYIKDKEAELERVRNDAQSFDIPELTQWYLEQAYNLTPEEARKLVLERANEKEQEPEDEAEE